MSHSNGSASQPQIRIETGKFCFPDPITIRGTFSTAAQVFTITALTRSGTVATATVAAGHGLSVGTNPIIQITGADQGSYNGFKKIIVTSQTQFTFVVPSGTVTPATGTINGAQPGCVATGTGTFASTDGLRAGVFVYVESLNAVRQVKEVESDTRWTFTENFPSDVSSEPVCIVENFKHKGISIENTGAGSGTLDEKTFAMEKTISFADWFGLAPICGDATDTSFYCILQKNLPLPL
jgi:hypothetical protein